MTHRHHHPIRAILGLLACVGLLVYTSAGSATAAKPPPAPTKKTTICHATGSATNPYVEITVSDSALDAHRRHQDGRDIIPAPPTGCPGDLVIPPTTPPGPNVLCVVSVGVTQTATTVTGTAADDTIDCSAASPGKTIDGFGGNDTITGTQFDDVITAGAGNDTVTGLGGNDVVSGSECNDTISGGEGNDVLTGSTGNDTISGEGGNDFLDGGLNDDVLSGGSGVNILLGGGGNDTCDGAPCAV